MDKEQKINIDKIKDKNQVLISDNKDIAKLIINFLITTDEQYAPNIMKFSCSLRSREAIHFIWNQ